MSTTVSELTLHEIVVTAECQPRAEMNGEVIHDYAEAMKGGADFPPLVVFFDGTAYTLADGYHRYEAAKLAGLAVVAVDVHPGSNRDALLYSVGANTTHGLRRTNADKRRAVLRLLQSPEWSKWSDREIAERCGVSHPFVGQLRESLSGNGFQIEPHRIVERNGTVYGMDTTGMMERRLIRADPPEYIRSADITGRLSPISETDYDHALAELIAVRRRYSHVAELNLIWDTLDHLTA